ncbi:MAG: gamma-glutamyl-gamma-aminobutyrate hydrolase family protein [Alphaproteobacteria bacterium]|nr:gamma-glutamyl-gamma-aminobutyrate hydrolase family protein [Alphaproteobacteria bacterium]
MEQQNNIRIAITNDTRLLRCRILLKLIEICGATPVPIPKNMRPSSMGVRYKHEAKSRPPEARENALQHHLKHVGELLETCHGILLPGNKYDVPPAAYGQTDVHPETDKRIPKDPLYARFETETLMIKHAIKNNWPILGICGGMHAANVVLGGSLIQHLPEDPRVKAHGIKHRDTAIKKLTKTQKKEWEQTFESTITYGNPPNIFNGTHDMRVVPGSLLEDIYRTARPETNMDVIKELSLHHQGCFDENLAPGMRASAYAPDGVVEAMELTTHSTLCLLTQFHFECDAGGIAEEAVKRLVDAAKANCGESTGDSPPIPAKKARKRAQGDVTPIST